MLVPFSMIALGTQLVMTVADGVPKYDIARGCRLDSTQALDLSTGQNETVKRCVADEQQALAQPQTQWPQFAPSDRVMCTGETTEGDGVPPSYVELLTCLQAQLFAKTPTSECVVVMVGGVDRDRIG